MNPSEFQSFLEVGVDRVGNTLSRHLCTECHACQPVRVLVQEFNPDRSMKRTWKANKDLQVRVGEPAVSNAKYELYQHYNKIRHPAADTPPLKVLYLSLVPMLEAGFYLGRELICVALADIIPTGLSMVSNYFEPEMKQRGLGTYAILWAIDHCRQQNRQYCYLGDCIHGFEGTDYDYKKRFIPHEILESDGAWHRK